MYAEEKYALKPKNSKKDSMYLEGYGKHWGEKLTFTIGFSYCISAFAGVFVGFRRARLGSLMTSHQWIINSISQSARTAGEFGNSGASVSLLYCLIGKLMDLLFEEEIRDYGLWTRNAITGGITGALYKSTLGFRPMVFGSILGVGLISSFTMVMNYLYEKGLTSYKIDV
ncbi:hypothetical protein SteCoe_23689 [Stentor coeruleus]|uniref:Mitochondrial import inner membrane translocase subunit TIM23 n=1 Tax=Stentor coeruleus TaxID=5963 RepID=A0A1R2BJ94_9CILI|nr:hypothetical protein SteCoe_23689 [Stentor coeruleus]